MGCNGCKQRPLTQEETLLRSFEQSLNLHTHKLLTLDRILHRYSSNFTLSLSQLEKAFSDLNLDLERFLSFYTFFYSNSQFSLCKLNCLGILLSSESIPQKLKILFQTYDKDTNGTISRERLEMMISDLLEVACVFIPKGALNQDPKNGKLLQYVKEICSVRKSVGRRLVLCLVEEKEEISERDFVFSYQRDEMLKCLLSAKEMREYCYDLKKNVLGSVESIMSSISEENIEVINILNYKGRKAKKRRGPRTNQS